MTPHNTNIASLYEFTLQQMAAESYFEGIAPSDTDKIKDALIRGTNRLGYPSDAGDGNTSLNQGYPGYTRMTSQQADEFLAKFKIVHQWSDNPSTGPTPGSRPPAEGIDGKPKLNAGELLANTGLSATLIQNKATGEFTLAIRSTGSRSWAKGGDDVRDMCGADRAGVFGVGFALAQQDALEQYYQWLKDNGKLPPGAKLNVTGYSLGGNLATVFTEMHQGNTDILFGETVTMNGAGRGTWDYSAGTLSDMVNYYHQILNNPTIAPSRPLTSVEKLLRDNALAVAASPFSDKNIYNDPRHLWAVEATKIKFKANLDIADASANENRTGTAADGRITQMFGFETINNVNATANSGIHGPALRVGVESQPAVEGWLGGRLWTEGDYGNGHSITLLADSLALQRAMHKLDANFELAHFISLLPSTSFRDTKNGLDANYEADPLENVLDALRRAILGTGVAKTEFKDGASGFGDITKREIYQANIKALTDSAAFKALEGKVILDPLYNKSATALFGLAKNGDIDATAYRYALKQLNPFAILGVPSLYDKFNVNGELKLYDPASGQGELTEQWLADRAALLRAVNMRNTQNVNIGNVNDPLAPGGQVTDFVYVDPAQPSTIVAFNIQRPGITPSQHQTITFGSNTGATLVGTNSQLGDHLYGGAGIDTLKGYAGKDYLEGGAGADTLLGGLDDDTLNGGKDFDTYQIDSTDGHDTIQDSDGQGKVTLAGIVLSGGKHVAGTQAVWESADGKVQYQKLYLPASNSYDLLVSVQGSSATARIENWQPSKSLGITLSDEVSTVVTLKNIEQYTAGVFDSVTGSNLADKISTGAKTDFVYSGNGDDYVYLGAGKDVANGGAGQDWIDGGSEQDYILGGAILGSAEQASLERDILIGGQGSDLIQGGLGDDILIGAERGTDLGGADQLTQGDWLLGGEGEDIVSGSLARDFINGGAGADSLDGAGADTVYGDDLAPMEAWKQGTLTQSYWRTRRASVPQRLCARGLGVVCTPAVLHQHRGLHANSAATANWLRRCGTATRHVCGLDGLAGENIQDRNAHSMRLTGNKWPEKRMDGMKPVINTQETAWAA